MAEKKHSREKVADKNELIRQLASSRDRMGADLGRLACALDVKSKLEGSVRRHAKSWLTFAAVGGVVMALAPGRRSRSSKRGKGRSPLPPARHGESGAQARRRSSTPLILDLLKLAVPVLKPVALAFATRQAAALAARIGGK